MAITVTEHPIEGVSVYGVQQMQYTVDGLSGQDFATALTLASFKQSTAIENASSSYSAVVRQRQKKVNDLGDVLAVIAKAVASLSTDDNPKPSDKSDADDALKTASKTADYYGVSVELTDGNKITRRNAMLAQNDIKYELDVEDNQLQQDCVSLQSMMTKRDNAFSSASKLLRKALNASGSTIGNM